MRPGSFMNLLNKVLKERGWSRYKLAKELAISQTSLNYYISNPGSIKLPLICRLRSLAVMDWAKFGRALDEQLAELTRKADD